MFWLPNVKKKSVCGRDPGHGKAKLFRGQSGCRKVGAHGHELLAREPQATPPPTSP